MKVKMIKNVYDGKVYHKAGQQVDITNDVATWYFSQGYAEKIHIDEPTIEIVKEEKAEIETKEEKVSKRKTKAIEDATDSDS